MRKDKFLSVLKVNKLFKDISSEIILNYYKENRLKFSEYEKNSVIHFESEVCKYMDVIIQGEVIVQKIDEKGNVLTIAEFSKGDNLGENLLFSNRSIYPMSIMAKKPTLLLQVSRELILELCQEDRNFLLQFLNCISVKTNILTSKIQSISLKSIRESIIDFLNYEYRVQNSYRINLEMSKKDLAERMGIQRTSLSRELGKMKKDGLVDFDAYSITVKDRKIIK